MDIKKQLNILNAVLIAVGGIGLAGGAIVFFQNIIKPKISIDSVDYANGIATIRVNGKVKTLYKNSTLSAGAAWGLRFNGQKADTPTRIELVKNDLVYRIY